MDSEHRLFIGKIPSSVTSEQLFSYFSQFGTVKDVLYPHSTKPLRIGFVTYSSKEELDAALAFPHEISGSRLNVTIAQPRSSRGQASSTPDLKKETRIFIGGVPPGTTMEELEGFFAKFGRITKVAIPPGSNPTSPLRGYAFITFSSAAEKENALATSSYPFKGGELRVFAAKPKTPDYRPSSRRDYPPQSSSSNYYPLLPSYMEPPAPSQDAEMEENPTRLFVGRLPNDTTKEELKEYFSNYGVVESVVKPSQQPMTTGQEPKAYAFVSFRETREFWRALAASPHTFKEHKIEVIEARPKSSRRGPVPPSSQPTEHRIFVGRIPESVTETELKEYFSQFGEVKDIFRPKSSSKDGSYFVFIIYETLAEIAKVLQEETHTIHQGGQALNVTRARPRHQRDAPLAPPSPPRHGRYNPYPSQPPPSRSAGYRPYDPQPGYESSYNSSYSAPPPPPPPSFHNNPYMMDPYATSGSRGDDDSRILGYEMLDPYGRNTGGRNVPPQYGVAPIPKSHHRLGYTPY